MPSYLRRQGSRGLLHRFAVVDFSRLLTRVERSRNLKIHRENPTERAKTEETINTVIIDLQIDVRSLRQSLNAHERFLIDFTSLDNLRKNGRAPAKHTALCANSIYNHSNNPNQYG